MKRLLLNLALITYSLTPHAQPASPMGRQDSGFTNKAEAKNQMVNGLKEGKWIEYMDSAFKLTIDTNALYYRLCAYRKGKSIGIVHGYFKSGKLAWEVPYIEGVRNGTGKHYYENGKLKWEIPCTNDKIDGLVKEYYESGKVKTETTFIKGQRIQERAYDENGKEIKW